MKGYRYHDEKTNKWHVGSFLSYQEARKKLRKLGIKSMNQLEKLRKEDPLSVLDLPKSPNTVYQKEWVNFFQYFGNQEYNFLSYEQAKKKLRRLGITSTIQLERYRKNKPLQVIDIPKAPQSVYRKEWKNYYEYFEKDQTQWLDYDEAKKIVQKLGIKTRKEFKEMKRNHPELLKNIPISPQFVYAKPIKVITK